MILSPYRWLQHFIFCVMLSCFLGCSQNQSEQLKQLTVWKTDLKSEIQALGYRNWIVIADASFPFYNRSGIRTVVAPVETPEIVSEVISTIETTQHVKPQFYVARELNAIKNRQAPGITTFRQKLETSLKGQKVTEIDDATLNRLLQGTSSTYAILVIKSQTSLPYTSVFVELDSGYWDAEAEQELRKRLNKKASDSGEGHESNANLAKT